MQSGTDFHMNTFMSGLTVNSNSGDLVIYLHVNIVLIILVFVIFLEFWAGGQKVVISGLGGSW